MRNRRNGTSDPRTPLQRPPSMLPPGGNASPLTAFDRVNPDHHIWCNNGTYFIHLTLLCRGSRKLRVRMSLKTKDVVEARRRRDLFLANVASMPELELLARAPRAPMGSARGR